jgi:hypothetical protein
MIIILLERSQEKKTFIIHFAPKLENTFVILSNGITTTTNLIVGLY